MSLKVYQFCGEGRFISAYGIVIADNKRRAIKLAESELEYATGKKQKLNSDDVSLIRASKEGVEWITDGDY